MKKTFYSAFFKAWTFMLVVVTLLTFTFTGCEFREDPAPEEPAGPIEYFKKELGDPALVEYNALDYLEIPSFSELKIYKSEIDRIVAYELAKGILDGATFDTFKDAGSARVALFDTANVTYKGRAKDESLTLSEETIAGMDNSSQTGGYDLVIGSGGFIGEYFGGKGKPNKGFEEQLIGMNVGDTKDITVTFPDGYQSAELQGVEVIFNVKINSIKRAKVESFVPADEQTKKDTGGEYETTEAYKEYLENYYKGALAYEVIYSAIKSKAECQALVDIFTDIYIHEYVIYAKGQELTQAEYDAAYAEIKQSMYKVAHDAAVEEAHEYIVSRYMFDHFEITLTEEEFNTRVQEIWDANKDYYMYYGMTGIADFIEYFSRDMLELSFKNDKLLKVIGDSVTIVE